MSNRALLAVLLAVPVAAQGTLVVDQAGGVGVFTDIPAALAVASSGDKIFVKAGPNPYRFGTTNKGVAIVGEAGVVIADTMRINNLPAGSVFTARNVAFAYTYGVDADSCQGRVHLEKLSGHLCAGATFRAFRADHVTIHDCTTASWSTIGLTMSASTVAISHSRILGKSAFGTGSSAPGLFILQSKVTIGYSLVTGGPGYGVVSRSAIQMNGASTLIFGGDSATLIDGAGPVAIEGMNGSNTVVLHVVTRLVGQITGATATRTAFPTLDADSAPLGGVLQTTVNAGPGDASILIGGFPDRPQATAVGDLWIAIPTLATLDVGPTDLFGVRTVPIPVPVLPALIGAPVTFQSFAGPSVPSARLSTPATVILR